MHKKASFADIILPLPLPKLLTYRVPSQHLERITSGSRVLIPLGAKKIFTGLVERIHTESPDYLTKDIIEVLDESPIIHAIQLRFFRWLASYYLCTLGEVMLAALPNGFRLSSQSKIQLHPETDLEAVHLSAQEQLLVNSLGRRTDLTYVEASVIVAQKNIYHLIQSLLHKKVILLFEEVREKYTPKKAKRVRLNDTCIQNKVDLQQLFETLAGYDKQLEVLPVSYTHLTLPTTPYV